MEKPESSYIEVMGDTPYNKILDFLINVRGLWDYSITEIAKEADVAWVTTEKIIKDMLRKGIIKKTREVGRADMYMIDEDNPKARALVAQYLIISKVMFDLKAGEPVFIEYKVTETSVNVNMSRVHQEQPVKV